MPGLGFAQQRLKWRLMAQGHSDHLTKEEQRRELRLAFRRWSEVAPLSFQEDLTCPMAEIDIWVGFGTRRHLGCPWAFDGLGGELAHTLLPGEIHLDDDEPYNTSPSDQGVGLLQVAVHEIGHVLGLPHLLYPGSVMHPFYPTTGGTVELSWHDRRAIQELYGQCEDPFDTVFDWVRRQSSQKGEPVLRFNTFFFRGGQYWLYENRHSRPRLGDPRRLTAGWRGLPEGGVDAFVHVWTPKIDARFFFKGTQFWRYDSSTDRVFTQDPEGQRYPRRISEGFPGVSGPIDAAVFLRREGRIYFFKGQEVLAFGVSSNQTLPGFPKRLEEVFPASIQEDHPTGNLDAAYYSYTHHTLFLFKDKFFWEVAREGSTEHPMSHNALLPRRRVAEQWLDLCDVHPSTLDER
ncbi:MMP21 protein, partial [Atractosteus spatula]|nr:MMP21 protein [Atractosteus spatula]